MVLKTAKIDMHRKTDFFEVVSQVTGFKLFVFESVLAMPHSITSLSILHVILDHMFAVPFFP
jgi:hypothetical protein